MAMPARQNFLIVQSVLQGNARHGAGGKAAMHDEARDVGKPGQGFRCPERGGAGAAAGMRFRAGEGIDDCVAVPYGKMQVRKFAEPGHADLAKHLSFCDAVTFFHRQARPL